MALAVALTAGIAPAQPGCPPVNFQGAASTSLKPGTSTHIVVLRQNDGSYSTFELADASPYRLIRTTPNFQQQLAGCPGLPVAGVPPGLQPAEVFTRVASGGYLWVRRSDVYGPPGSYASLLVAAFDANLSLLSEVQYPVAIVEALAVVDVNGDGILDILAATAFPHSSGLQVLLGNGGSSFQQPLTFTISTSLFITSMAVADLNGDRKLDVVLSSGFPGATKISVFLGNGDGTFQAERIAFSGITYKLGAVAIGDLNGDGKPDLAFTLIDDPNSNYAPEVAVALGAGDGTFGAQTPYLTGGSDSLAIADMNGDGFPDIVGSGFTILFGDGKGAFPHRADYWQEVAGSILLADFDGDGKPDILVGTGSATAMTGPALAVLFARGSGLFAGPPISPDTGVPPTYGFIEIQSPGDFNGDGYPDLVVRGSNSIDVLTGVGDGTFRQGFHYATGIGTYTGPFAVADMNHDGKLDLVVTIAIFGFGIGAGTATLASTQVLLGNGDGTFQAQPVTTSVCCVTGIAVADFNGDGHADLAVLLHNLGVGPTGDQMLVYLGTGGGSFAAPLSSKVGVYPSALVAGDFNHDGKLDLVVEDQGDLTSSATPGSGYSILLGKGDGTFSTPAAIPLGLGSGLHPAGLVAADLNRDGRLDLAVTFTNGPLLVLPGRGDGTFPAPTSYSVAGFTAPAVADLNGDGVPDLMSGSGPNWLLGTGDGSFQPEVTFAGSSSQFTSVVAADFNHDGRADLAAAGYPTGIAALLNVSQPAQLTVVSAASFSMGPLAPDSLATAFGSGLAPNTSVVIAGTSAQILYASPGQVNFLLPPALPSGQATVTVSSSAGSVSVPVPIAAVAPALFTRNAAGLAAAYAVRVSQGNQTGVTTSEPIDLGQPGDQVYVSLFGTGIRGAAAGQVSVRVQGLDAPVYFAGPQIQFPGLDQVNILLPRELAGTGDAGVVLTAGGTNAPTVHLLIK